MSKKYQLQILWTVRCDPISIIEMLNDERITALIASEHMKNMVQPVSYYHKRRRKPIE